MIKIDDFKEIYILYEFVKISVEAILRKLKFKVYNILSRTMKNQKKKKNHIGGYFPGGAVVRNPSANAGDMGSSPGPGGSHMAWSN